MEQLDWLERNAWPPGSTPREPDKASAFGTRLSLDDVWVALLGERIAGYVAVGRRTPLASNSKVGVIRAIVVAQDLRRLGIGRRLLERAEAEATRRGWTKLGVAVLGSNSGARSMYRALGFRLEGRLRGEYLIEGADVDDLLMAKYLSQASQTK